MYVIDFTLLNIENHPSCWSTRTERLQLERIRKLEQPVLLRSRMLIISE